MSATPDNCFHLTIEIVQEIHTEVIAKFGGSNGVRELALLESAVAAPQASFDGTIRDRKIAQPCVLVRKPKNPTCIIANVYAPLRMVTKMRVPSTPAASTKFSFEW